MEHRSGAKQCRSTERFAGLACGQGLGWFVGSLMDRKVHLLGVLSACLAAVGTLVWWARPEADNQGVAGPEYLSAGTGRPDMLGKHAHDANAEPVTSITGAGGAGGVVKLEQDAQARP